ncbi:hypothetical protein [Hymenobacter sp.]|jgi:hypothetical protein|uniref:heavy-metal-associated domain-containing protein n=1 Tax=Hymenobacter sp. TaxID=1898978 RepID=UPI002ED7BCCD
MPALQFKTSINCANCLRAVTPFLDAEASVKKWNVDTNNPDKVLTVEGENVIPELVMKAVAQAGFDIEPVTK